MPSDVIMTSEHNLVIEGHTAKFMSISGSAIHFTYLLALFEFP